MKMSSTLWIIVIALGAVLAALGNINYNRARDKERAIAASTKALSMLKAETTNNRAKLQSMRVAFTKNSIEIVGFQDTAWKIVSEGGLLAQMDQPTLSRVTDVYYRIGLLNGLHSRLLELFIGASSALSQSPQIRQELMKSMSGLMNEVEPLLHEIESS